jgi:SAM-dependent methyltransferase
MLQLIEHVEDPVAIARRVFELLRPGGIFVVETPNLAGFDYQIFRGRWWGHYHFPRHWNLFSRDSLERMLRGAGFAIERSEALISTSAWTISLGNYFLDRGYPRWLRALLQLQESAPARALRRARHPVRAARARDVESARDRAQAGLALEHPHSGVAAMERAAKPRLGCCQRRH